VECGVTGPGGPTEAEVRATLNTIVDPCSVGAGSPAGLDDMGLIRRVELTETAGAADLLVVIGVTEYGCLMGAPFAMEAYRLLEALPGVGAVQVDLDQEFDWLPEDMSPTYRAHLQRRHVEGRRRLGPGALGFPLLTITPTPASTAVPR
jgi:metal-sulfur cluster biosynthetic enzyme